jgi:TolA-binding protein
LSEEKHGLQQQADRSKPNGSRSVLIYLIILFAAAVVLLLMAFFMQKRTNDQTIDGLKQSVSAIQSAQDAYEENIALREQVEKLEDQIQAQQSELDDLEQENNLLQQKNQDLILSTQALDWFWQINEAYVRGRTALAKELIEQMGDELPKYLPTQSSTDNDRFSPYDRYQEIYKALYE